MIKEKVKGWVNRHPLWAELALLAFMGLVSLMAYQVIYKGAPCIEKIITVDKKEVSNAIPHMDMD